MKLATALLLAFLTLCSLALLDKGCEAFVDNFRLPGPVIFSYIDAISPIHLSYIILPVAVGLSSWLSDLRAPFLFIPFIILIACIMLGAISLASITMLNGPRDVTSYRYAGNLILIGLACFLTYYIGKRKKANQVIDPTRFARGS